MYSDVLTTLKILIIGESGVGKSSLLLRFTDGTFDPEIGATIGVDFKEKTVDIDGNRMKLALWDTAGQEKYKAIIRAHFRRAAGALVVYDITNETSYNNVQNWIKELKENADEDVVIMLVGTKLDIVLKNRSRRKVTREEAKIFADKHQMLFEETSSVQNHKVSDCFENLLQEIYDNRNSKYEKPEHNNEHGVGLSNNKIYERNIRAGRGKLLS